MTSNYQRALDLANHIAEVDETPRELVKQLHQYGLLAPDLPAPMQRWEAERTGGTSGSRWYGYEDDGNDNGSVMYSPHRYIDTYPGEVWVDGDVLLSPEGARAYALALLAAANHAEGAGQ